MKQVLLGPTTVKLFVVRVRVEVDGPSIFVPPFEFDMPPSTKWSDKIVEDRALEELQKRCPGLKVERVP